MRRCELSVVTTLPCHADIFQIKSKNVLGYPSVSTSETARTILLTKMCCQTMQENPILPSNSYQRLQRLGICV